MDFVSLDGQFFGHVLNGWDCLFLDSFSLGFFLDFFFFPLQFAFMVFMQSASQTADEEPTSVRYHVVFNLSVKVVHRWNRRPPVAGVPMSTYVTDVRLTALRLSAVLERSASGCIKRRRKKKNQQHVTRKYKLCRHLGGAGVEVGVSPPSTSPIHYSLPLQVKLSLHDIFLLLHSSSLRLYLLHLCSFRSPSPCLSSFRINPKLPRG